MGNEDKMAVDTELKNEVKYRWYAPLNRNNLIVLLAGGVISPSKGYANYEKDLQRFAGDGFLLVRNGISSKVIDSEDLSGNAGFTVLVEINIDDLDTASYGLDEQGEFSDSTISINKSDACFLSLIGVIPITKVEAVHFRSDSDKKNFIVRQFENVPMDIIPFEVSEQLFKHDVSDIAIQALERLSEGNNDDCKLKKHYAKSDSYTGCVALLVNTIPTNDSWFYLLEKILISKDYNCIPSLVASEIIQDKLDCALFATAFSMMMEMDVSQGWQAKKVLSDIYASINKDILTEKELKQLNVWLIACEDILNNKRSVTPLSDSKMKVGRAILLLLLRPNPIDVLNSSNSSLKPGMEVLSLAAMLSGARYGFESLPNELKSTEPGFGLYANLKSDLINIAWEKSVLHAYSCVPKVNIIITEWAVVGQCYEVLIDDKTLLEIKDEGPEELRSILTLAKSTGINMIYERGHLRLNYCYEFNDGHSNMVYISVCESTNKNYKIIRFWSKCLDISTTKGKKIFNKAMWRVILEKNCEPSVFCRFGVSEAEKSVLIISDQMVSSINNNSLIPIIENVAITADNFRREYGLK